MGALISIIAGMSGRSSHSVPVVTPRVTWPWTKDIKKIPNNTAKDYAAFGFITENAAKTGIDLFTPIGTGHLTGKDVYWAHMPYSTRQWSDYTLLREDEGQLEDIAGGVMHNGNTVVFYTKSPNGFNTTTWVPDVAYTDHTIAAYYIIYDADKNIVQGPTDYIGGTSGVEQLDRGWAFGTLQLHDTAGRCSICMVQLNIDGSRYKIGELISTDNFATFNYYTCSDGAYPVSENVSAYYNGEMLKLARRDGDWVMYCSTDEGETWTAYGASGICFGGFTVTIDSMYVHDGGLLDVIYQDRSTGNIAISRDNVWANVFAKAQPGTGISNFNPSEIICNNAGVNSNYNGLGYPTMVQVTGMPGTYAYCFTNERERDPYGGPLGIAELYFSFDDFTRTTLPAAPASISTRFVDVTTAVIDLNGVTNTEYTNISHWLMDICTDSGFTIPINACIDNTSIDKTMQDVRVLGTPIFPFHLTANTTYYVRIKAVNNVGTSAYVTTSFTTLT